MGVNQELFYQPCSGDISWDIYIYNRLYNVQPIKSCLQKWVYTSRLSLIWCLFSWRKWVFFYHWIFIGNVSFRHIHVAMWCKPANICAEQWWTIKTMALTSKHGGCAKKIGKKTARLWMIHKAVDSQKFAMFTYLPGSSNIAIGLQWEICEKWRS